MGELAANTEHGSIAAHHQSQVTLGADLWNTQERVARNVHVMCRVMLKGNLATLVVQEVGNLFQCIA
jgi:hypothetical protein